MSENEVITLDGEVVVQNGNNAPANPFNRAVVAGHGANVGAIAIESERAIAEAQGELTLAKKFPRSVSGAIVEFMEACKDLDFAKTAFYTVPNRGTGPSIRFAEEAARCYGNFNYGHRELSRTDDKSEIEIYAWDKEKNNRSNRQITVNHISDTKEGPKKLTNQTDIDNKIANVAAKQMRGRILALMPKHLVAKGIAECKRTLAGGGNAEKPISARIVDMSMAFGRFGVNKSMMERYLKHSVDDINLDELADLTGIFNAIKEGGKVADYFKAEELEAGSEKPVAPAAAAIAAAAKKGNAADGAGSLAAATKPKAVGAKSKPAPEPQPDLAPAPEPEGDAQEPSGADDDVF